MTGKRGGPLWHLFGLLLWPWVWADGRQLQQFSPLPTNTAIFASDSDLHADSAEHQSFCPSTFRFGEADHPGPDDPSAEPDNPDVPYRDPSMLRIGCSNPSGLNGKEHTALQLGPGIWCFSETHLTYGLQRSSAATIAYASGQMNRQVRAHFGGPVPFRANSLQAGT
eukprot:s1946_g7.t1